MRDLIERFSYRFQVWQRERYGDYSPADPTARDPLRFVAVVAVMSVILGVTAPFVFHREFDVVAMTDIFVALVFLALYHSKSRWAWHLVVAWVPFTLVLYWILRLGGYSRYQPRLHSLAAEVIGYFFQLAFFVAVLVWLFHIRDRYFKYTEHAQQQT
jgi:hypothetical protein